MGWSWKSMDVMEAVEGKREEGRGGKGRRGVGEA